MTAATQKTAETRWWTTVEIPVQVSMTTPAVRMTAVNVWRDDVGEFFDDYTPVVALQATTVRRFSKVWVGQEPIEFFNAKELLDQGFDEEKPEIQHTALIIDFSTGVLIPYDDPSIQCKNNAWRLVACPWDPSEDEKRLAPVVEQMKTDICKRCKTRSHA